jgi:UDP-N-acetylglucosamine acyltransferase
LIAKQVTMLIHPTAIIHTSARLANNVKVWPYAVIEEDVFIGENCEIGSHATIKRYTTLGSGNRIFEYAAVGGEPQDLKYRGERSYLIMGDNNLVREGATLHRATSPEAETRIGSRNLFMAGVHVAHDCTIGDDNIFANGAALAGHVTVEDHVTLSSNVGVHQFVRIGSYAMVGGKSKIVRDVLPFFITEGNPPSVYGLNRERLKRTGFSEEQRSVLKKAYKILFYLNPTTDEALKEMEELRDENVDYLVNFILLSREGRGFTRKRRVKRFTYIRDSIEEVSVD